MKVIFRQSYNPEIEIIELAGGLSGSGARELKDCLFSHMDENRCNNYAIINLKRVNKIDGFGINILKSFVSRGVDIRLLNVGPEIRSMLNISRKRDIFNRIYNQTDCNSAVSMFEKEILKNGKIVEKGIRIRYYPRVNTLFQIDFKYQPGHNGPILCKAKALNLSESGLFMSEIKAADLGRKKMLNRPDIVGQEFYDIKFKLSGDSKHIETKGKYVWKNETDGNLGVGIRFKDIRQDYKKLIRDYVYSIL